MSEFCFQCNAELMVFGPYTDFDHWGKSGELTPEQVAEGYGMIALCEGCGPTRVDHKGRCLGDCGSKWCRNADGSLPEVSLITERWLERREGRLGWALRLWDRWAGTPWDPGVVHRIRHWWRTRNVKGDEFDFNNTGDLFDDDPK